MKSLPVKYFGPSGLPVLFAVDESGTTAVGYLIKQVAADRFHVTTGDGSYVVAELATTLDQIADRNNMPFGTCTFLMGLLEGVQENVCRITAYRCSTVQGNNYQWHTAAPTTTVVSIIIPVLTDFVEVGSASDSTNATLASVSYDRLLENGSAWLLETGDNWLLEQAGPYLLLENEGFWLLEGGGYFELEGEAADG